MKLSTAKSYETWIDTPDSLVDQIAALMRMQLWYAARVTYKPEASNCAYGVGIIRRCLDATVPTLKAIEASVKARALVLRTEQLTPRDQEAIEELATSLNPEDSEDCKTIKCLLENYADLIRKLT